MVGDGDEIHPDLAAGGRQVGGRFLAIGVVGVHVGIAFIGAACEQILLQRIQAKFSDRLILLRANHQQIFLFTGELAWHKQIAVLR